MMQGSTTEFEQRPRKRVLLVLPFDMSVRNLITSPVAASLALDPTLEIKVISREASDGEKLLQLPGTAMSWEPILRPLKQSMRKDLPLRWRLQLLAGDFKYLIGHYMFMSLAFRFNSIKGFRGFLDRMKQSRSLRAQATREGLPYHNLLGFPFPRSNVIFRILKRLYFSRWQRHALVEELFQRWRPDVVVLTHLQSSTVTPYHLAARARGIPLLGINGSWDQPTTKGPMLPGLERVLAQSQQVVEDLNRYHDYPRDRCEVVGWPQMDVYADTSRAQSRQAFLASIGLEPQSRYMLVAAYSDRLGKHEPAMCQALIAAAAKGRFGREAVLYIRCHPLDREWKPRLGILHKPPRTVVEAPDLGALDHLANLIRHADVVIASAGTMNLDAIALDTPSIAVAFEDQEVPYYDRASRRYTMEHLAVVVATGGMRMVSTTNELIEAVAGYMADRTLDAKSRERLRGLILEPLDGRSSERIAAAIAAFAHNPSARSEMVRGY